MKYIHIFFSVILFLPVLSQAQGHNAKQMFHVVSFYTAKNDLAHISFVHEANKWFSDAAKKYHFSYDSTDNWNNLNEDFLKNYQVVLFFDTRPDSTPQREAFQKYMENGGAWMGFHFAGFALTPSAYPGNWDWYHNEFIGAGQYVSNTWRPVPAILKVENKKHPSVKGLPTTFKTAPSEWYRWERDLKSNPDISILLSVDPQSFPLGTGPKPHEIWHSGYYPIAWTNKKYKMIYTNMGHNDMDYEGKTNAQLSSTFSSPDENRFIINSILWLGGVKK
jgi:uncharacterized protein